MNDTWSRTFAMLAILTIVGPAATFATDRSQPLPANGRSTAAADKAAEAERLAALAAELAQRAAALAAESQTAATTPASAGSTIDTDSSQPGWTSRDAKQDARVIEISDAAEPAPTDSQPSSGWRSYRQAADIAVRFLGDPADDTPRGAGDQLAASEGTAANPLPDSDQDAASPGRPSERMLLNDENVLPAARTFQENNGIPDPAKMPADPPRDHHRGPDYGARLDGYDGCETDCCPPPPVLFWTAGVEATFLNPDLNSGGTSFLVEEFALDRVDTVSSFSDDVDSIYLSPRIWIGVQGCKWGANLRYWHLQASEGSCDPSLGLENEWDDPWAGRPDFGSFTCNRLEAYTIDLEITRRFCLHDCWMQASAGIRHASLEHSEGVLVNAITDDSALMGYGQASRYTRGTGLVMGLYGRRPIFPCSCVHWFYNVRWSAVWGPTETKAETAVLLAVQDDDAVANAGSTNSASSYVDDTLFIGEIQLGVEWNYALQCLPANAFFRAAVEYQRWDGGKGFSEAGSFAGVEIDDEPTTYAEAFASAVSPELDLLGISIGTGLTW